MKASLDWLKSRELAEKKWLVNLKLSNIKNRGKSWKKCRLSRICRAIKKKSNIYEIEVQGMPGWLSWLSVCP